MYAVKIPLICALSLAAGCGEVVADQPPSTPPSLPCASGNLFCDGFETFDLSHPQAIWNGSSTPTFAPEADIVHSGTRALKLTIPDSTQSDMPFASVSAMITPVTSNSLSMRAWLYVPSSLVVTQFDVFGVESGGSGGVVAFIIKSPTGVDQILAFNEITQMSTDAAITIPHDQWFCSVLQVNIDPANGSFTLASGLDTASSQAISLQQQNTAPSGGFQTVLVDMGSDSNMQHGGSIFVDDVEVSASTLNCE